MNRTDIPMRARVVDIDSIWREFSPRLLQFIGARVSDRETAEDILQDVFVKLQSQTDELREPSRIEAWLFRTARNATIDYYRVRKQTIEVPETMAAEYSIHHDPEMKELHLAFARLLTRLPEPYREAVLLTAFEGYSIEKLGRHQKISLSNAKSRVLRGRKQLKELLLEFSTREFRHTPGSSPCPFGLIRAEHLKPSN